MSFHENHSSSTRYESQNLWLHYLHRVFMLLDAFNIRFRLDFSSVTLDTGEKLKKKKTPASQAAPIIEMLIFI